MWWVLAMTTPGGGFANHVEEVWGKFAGDGAGKCRDRVFSHRRAARRAVRFGVAGRCGGPTNRENARIATSAT